MLLFLYTDGLSEARNAAGEEFDEQLLTHLAKLRAPEAGADEIFAAAEKFNAGTFADDVTIFVIGRGEL
jgi:serine phosphatase RsbU (regulator of sigma subunit)